MRAIRLVATAAVLLLGLLQRACAAPAFDRFYRRSFALPALRNGPLGTRARPAKSTGLASPAYNDTFTGVRVYRITDTGTDGNVPGVPHIRHEYSRRQVFNADNSRYIAEDGNGFWALFDASTFRRIRGRRPNGMLLGMAGDAEAIWHHSNPSVLFYWGGGLIWYRKDVRTDRDSVLVDFTGRLPWPLASQVWFKGEGTPSASGRFWGLMATHYDSAAQRNIVYGLLTWDANTNRIVGTLPASAFGGSMPDHVSTSASGNYIVPSWAYEPALGTRAYNRNFTSFQQLRIGSSHSDLAIGPAGQDLLVYADYDSGSVDDGWIVAVDCRTATSFRLSPLYFPGSSGMAVHISGKAFARPGWALISTYADSSNYGAVTPANPRQPSFRRIFAVELVPGGRSFAIAHTQTGANYGGYFGEPQASVNRDFTRVTWATNFGSGTRIESLMAGLPSWAIPAARRP
ncbi:putative lipoprotein [Hyaloraphidium curvatum]|nr:putative lipoprotein [Hyaloraphidium curvatum]